MAQKVEHFPQEQTPNERLGRALRLLGEFKAGRLPAIAELVAGQHIGDSAKVLLEGEALYLLVQCYRTRPREQGRFEAHQRYTDVQYMCEGQECIEVCDLKSRLGNLPVYDANGNVFFPLEAAASARVLLSAGEAVVLFPNDAHAACLRVDSAEGQVVHKIVVKVKDGHLAEAAP